MNHTNYYFGNLRSIQHHALNQLSAAIFKAYPHLDPHNTQDAFALHRHHSHAIILSRKAALSRWLKHYGRGSRYTGKGLLAANPLTLASQVTLPSDWLHVTLHR